MQMFEQSRLQTLSLFELLFLCPDINYPLVVEQVYPWKSQHKKTCLVPMHYKSCMSVIFFCFFYLSDSFWKCLVLFLSCLKWDFSCHSICHHFTMKGTSSQMCSRIQTNIHLAGFCLGHSPLSDKFHKHHLFFFLSFKLFVLVLINTPRDAAALSAKNCQQTAKSQRQSAARICTGSEMRKDTSRTQTCLRFSLENNFYRKVLFIHDATNACR